MLARLPLPEILFSAAMAYAAYCDARYRRIPNRVNLSIFIVGLAARLAVGGAMSVVMGLAGAATGIALLFLPFAVRWMGGGDVKLMGGAGAWLGPEMTLWATLFGLAAGGLVALFVLFTGGRKMRSEVGTNLKTALLTMSSPGAPVRPLRQRVPLGVPLGLAAVAVIIYRGGFHG